MSKPLKKAHWSPSCCDVCGETKVRALGHREYTVSNRTADFLMQFEDVCCQNCGFVYEQKRPDEDFLYDFYRDAHNRYSSAVEIHVDYDIQARLTPIERFVEKGARILEVGASTGHFCKSLEEAGYHAEGLDPLDQEDDPSVKKGFITERQNAQEHGLYDAIVSYYVLEHVRNADEWIEQLSCLLKEGGYLFLEVPDYKAYPHNSLTFEHMLHFRPHHADLLLKKHGFTVIRDQDYKASRYFGFVTVAQKTGARVEHIVPDFKVEDIIEEAVTLYQKAKEAEQENKELAQKIAQKIKNSAAGISNPVVCFWGANEYASRIVAHLKTETLPLYILDNSETKIGTHHEEFDRPIIRPDEEALPQGDKIFILCSPNWNKDIKEQIQNMKISVSDILDGTLDKNE